MQFYKRFHVLFLINFQPAPENVGNHLTEDITYVQAPPSASGEELVREEQGPAIQYVTPQQHESNGRNII